MKKKRPNIDDEGFEIASGVRIREMKTKAGTRYQVDLGRKSGKHVRKNFEWLKDAHK